jgi:uncharacterized protein (DUF58 family)
MRAAREFHYRLPERVRGHRPGSHLASTIGSGQEFVSHVSLYDRPDPRRLDLRASLRELRGDWLVRVHRQRASVAVHAVVDVSRSMAFGAERPKLHVVGDFLESLGLSAFRAGDAAGLLAFDAVERNDLFVPARVSRGVGSLMSSTVGSAQGARGGIEGLEAAALRLAGREGLVFLVSDFHWPLDRLGGVLDMLAHAAVVPLVVWDRAEVEPPTRDGFALLQDSESGQQRMLWLRPKLRARWREAVARRRDELNRIFESRSIRPFYVQGEFDAEALSKYFVEGSA